MFSMNYKQFIKIKSKLKFIAHLKTTAVGQCTVNTILKEFQQRAEDKGYVPQCHFSNLLN